MKRSIIFFSILFFALSLRASETTFEFTTGTWDYVTDMAKVNGKLIFVEAYASYCPPCKMLDEDVFTDTEVSSYFNDNFINYKVDMMSKEGQFFKSKYNVKFLPDLIFINSQGKIVYRENGYQDKDKLLAVARRMIDEYGIPAPVMRKPIHELSDEMPGEMVQNNKSEDRVSDYYTQQTTTSNVSGLHLITQQIERLKSQNGSYNHLVPALFTKENKRRIETRKSQYLPFMFSILGSGNMNVITFCNDNYKLLKDTYGADRVMYRMEKSILSAAKRAKLASDRNTYKLLKKMCKRGDLKQNKALLMQLKAYK